MNHSARPSGRPHMIRVPDDLWEAARVRSQQRGETLSELFRAFLRRYVRRGQS